MVDIYKPGWRIHRGRDSGVIDQRTCLPRGHFSRREGARHGQGWGQGIEAEQRLRAESCEAMRFDVFLDLRQRQGSWIRASKGTGTEMQQKDRAVSSCHHP